MDYINFRAVAVIKGQEIATTGTLKQCSEWADEMLEKHLSDLKEIRLINLDIKKEN